MLDRTYIVPEIRISEGKEEHGIEECISRLITLKNAVSLEKSPAPSAIETELNLLFAKVGGEKIVSEMERVVVLLCKIAQRIIRRPAVSSEDKLILLQIFELGLFMAQFKDRWLERLEKTDFLEEHRWTPSVPYIHPEQVFAPARELVSLAQEYLLRKEALEDSRCDICAFALGNLLAVHHSSTALLLRQPLEQGPALGAFFFLAYVFSESEDTRAELLSRWLHRGIARFDTVMFYLPEVDLLQFFGREVARISEYPRQKKILLSAKSHALIYLIDNGLLELHRQGRISTSELSHLLVSTYTEEECLDTERILEDIAEYSPAAAEAITKSLIIFKQTAQLSRSFFANSVLIDKDYVECAIICKESFELIPAAKLKELCSSEYLSLWCRAPDTFGILVRCVAEAHAKHTVVHLGEQRKIQHGWNLYFFIEKVFASLDVSLGAFDKALQLINVFPFMEMFIKRCLWNRVDSEGLHLKLARAPAAALHQLQTLSHFRELPQVQRCLFKALPQLAAPEQEALLFSGTADLFVMQWIKKQIEKCRKDKSIQKLYQCLVQIKDKEELQNSSYWGNLLRKDIVFGKMVSSLARLVPPEELLHYLHSEEDLARLLRAVTKEGNADPFLLSSLLEKLDQQNKYEEGAVLGAASFISLPVSTTNLTVYLTLVQKEFSERQSLARFVGEKSSLEVYLVNGKGKIAYSTYRQSAREERVTDLEEEFEQHPLGGWKISLALTVTSRSYRLKIGETDISEKVAPKRLTEVVLGEGFKGILKRALVVEESTQHLNRQSTKPSDLFFLDVLLNIEKTLQYQKKFAVQIGRAHV